MNNLFLGKKIAFLGDSITQGGTYINYMRAYFSDAGIKTYLFNRGNAGCRAEMAVPMLQEEIFSSPFDIVFIQYGINDMGIWLYDGNKKADSHIIGAREKRDEVHFNAMKQLALKIRENGKTPVFVTIVPVNERLHEEKNIKTVADNQEKEDFIGPAFYTRKTFKNINDGCRRYADRIIGLGRELNVDVVDIFTPFYEQTLIADDLFGKDGIHPTEKGHMLMAEVFLRFMGCDAALKKTEFPDKQRKVMETERKYRFIQSFRRELFQSHNTLSEQQLYERAVNEVETNPGYSDYLRDVLKNLWFKIEDLRSEELKLVLDMYN